MQVLNESLLHNRREELKEEWVHLQVEPHKNEQEGDISEKYICLKIRSGLYQNANAQMSPLVRPHGATHMLVDAGDILLKGCKVQMKRVDEGGLSHKLLNFAHIRFQYFVNSTTNAKWESE